MRRPKLSATLPANFVKGLQMAKGPSHIGWRLKKPKRTRMIVVGGSIETIRPRIFEQAKGRGQKLRRLDDHLVDALVIESAGRFGGRGMGEEDVHLASVLVASK